MPMGCLSLVPYVASILEKQKPSSVLDLGIGMGFYGAVVRQWVDRGYGRHTTLVGVEGFNKYENACWDLYDAIHTLEIKTFLEKNGALWDTILLMDVIEHFDDPEAIIVMCKEKLSSGGKLIIGTPAVWMEQGAAYGNEYEMHRSLISVSDLEDFEIICDGSMDQFGNQMILGVYTRD